MKQLKAGSQNQNLIKHMAHGRSVTPLSALHLFGCLRLGGRIHELRRRGHKIKREMIALSSGKRIASYSMPAFRA